MTKDELRNRYFNWMYRLVCDNRYAKDLSYRKLLRHLFETDFTYTISMDGNREADGIDLRYRFGYDQCYDLPVIASDLDDCPCSILEMMIALAIRCEEHIMDNPDVGDRTGQWFWNMIVSLGLGSMSDIHYDETYTDAVILRFLNRQYDRNGQGGLFTVHNSEKDMRTAEIWYQMCWYLAEENMT